MMTVLNVEVFDRFQDVEPFWRDLEAKADLHVYQSFDWISGWYRDVGERTGVRPCLVTVRGADDEPLMLLPLAVEPGGLWRRLVWMGAAFFDYHTPILVRGADDVLGGIGREAIWRAIAEKLPPLDYADFERQPERVGGRANPLIDENSVPCFQSAHHTQLFGDWTAYYTLKRGRQTRRNDRRKRRKLEGLGHLRFIVADNAHEIDRLIGAMIRQKQDYATARGEACLLAKAGYAAFLRNLARQGLSDGSVLLCGLEFDGEILAAQWGAIHRGRLYSIVSSYSQNEHSRLSPGEMLLHDTMRWCFDNGIETFDFTYGDEPYKEAWCEHHVTLYRSAMPLSTWGAVRISMLSAFLGLKRWAKERPWLMAVRARAQKWVWSV